MLRVPAEVFAFSKLALAALEDLGDPQADELRARVEMQTADRRARSVPAVCSHSWRSAAAPIAFVH